MTPLGYFKSHAAQPTPPPDLFGETLEQSITEATGPRYGRVSGLGWCVLVLPLVLAMFVGANLLRNTFEKRVAEMNQKAEDFAEIQRLSRLAHSVDPRRPSSSLRGDVPR